MRRAAIYLSIIGLLAGLTGADESFLYRGQTTAEWLHQLAHPSASARAAAAQAFVTIGKGNEASVEPLIGLLSDRDEQVRFYAAYALGKIEVRPQQCIAALIKSLPDKDEHVRYTTQWSLAQIAQQIAESSDDKKIVDDSLANLLAEAETQLLVAGALPGHLKQIRAAIARCETPVTPQVTLQPPILVSGDENGEIDRCLQAFAADDLPAKVKAVERLRLLGATAVQRLLASPEAVVSLENVRWHLPVAIASLGEPVVPVLTQALRHPSDEISELAAKSLIELGPLAGGALPDLIHLLESDETPEALKFQAIEIMKGLGPAAGDATDLLTRVLNDVERDDLIQASAAEALGSIGPAARRAVPALIERLGSGDDSGYVRPNVAAALVRIDPKSEEVTQALLVALQKSEDIYAAIGIAERLCECGPGASKIVPRLIEAIDETSFDERASVLTILGQLGAAKPDEVSPLLVARLMDPEEELMVRVAAAKALGKLGPNAIQPVINELQHGDEANQLIAARTLVEIGLAASPAERALSEMLIDRRADNELRALAAVALGQLGAEANAAAPALTEMLRAPESDSYLRSMCAVALGQVDPAAVPVLESILDDAEPEVQIASAYSLCKLNPKHARGLATLVHWLESDEYRGAAIKALGDIGETALPQVVETLTDRAKSRDSRAACVEVLSAFDERAVTPLLHALDDTEISEEASWALRDRGNKLLPTLVASMDDEANFTPQARAVMGRVIEDMFSGLGGGDGDAAWAGGHPLVRRPEGSSLAMEAAAMEIGAAETEMEAARMAMAEARANMLGAELLKARATGASGGMSMRPQPAKTVSPYDAARVEQAEQSAEAPPAPVGYKTVDVFYGTNRKPIDEASAAKADQTPWFWFGAGGVLVAIVVLVGMYRRGARKQATAGLAGLTLILFLGLLILAPTVTRPSIDKSGPQYGGEYSDRVEMGVCEVTIPDSHREGVLDTATLLRFQLTEDLQKHIVLRRVHHLEPEAFFAGLKQELQSKGNNILVFIHGYNVSFEDAARRTAQMSADLKFAGAPVFYSWPSQAELLKYRMDEKNVELSVDQLKSFLLDLAQRSQADTIDLIAHSMGNRALTDALKEMDVAAASQQQRFNQVILAAPDIDADVFKHRIAPAIVSKAKHITLYASSKDVALDASRKFNSGDPRAGDAGENLVVVPGIETIDVSSGDSSLLGHSYYGDNVSVLQDIEFLLRDEPASSRRYLEPVSRHGDLTYWLFRPERISHRIDRGNQPH